MEPYSKQQKKAVRRASDPYTYDQFPEKFRVQIVHIWYAVLGDQTQYQQGVDGPRTAYRLIVEFLCQEHGYFVLPNTPQYDSSPRHFQAELIDFFLRTDDIDLVLDTIQFSFQVIDDLARRFDYLHLREAPKLADGAIEALNSRFQEHRIGYRFSDGKLFRIDSELLHSELTAPTLILLRSPEYKGAQDEFLKAHDHDRHGRTKETLVECLKAIESVLKVICAKRGWAHDPTAPCKTLLQVIFDNGLVPSYWASHFSGLRSTLESGVPTARNKLAGHGQGDQVIEVPGYIAAYILHQTACAIVFLTEAEKALP